MDLQYGHREATRPVFSGIMTLRIRFCRTARGRLGLIGDRRRGAMPVRTIGAPTAGRAARRPRCPHLLGCSQVRLRQSDLFFRTRNLTLVPFQYSLVHRSLIVLFYHAADHGLGREHERGDGSCIL